MTNALALE